MTQPMIDLRTTPYGGRSIFAIQPIAQGIHILACETPFAHVIYKDYRREVCAQCFAYAASASRNIGDPRTWSIRSCRAASESVWFCTDECKIAWESGMIGPLIADTNALLAKAQIATRKKVKGRRLCHDSPDPILPNGPTATLQITQDHIDEAWTHAEDLASSPARLSSLLQWIWKTWNLKPRVQLPQLLFSDMYSIAVLPISHFLRKSPHQIRGQKFFVSRTASYRTSACGLTFSWHIYVYTLFCVIRSHNISDRMFPTIRNLLARDTGNAFGIWDGDSRDEMLGWGVWVGASYFNHSCCPNVKKTRVGRTMQFTTSRSVETGEELCISYIDINQTITQRRQELEDSWFFTCQCQRCQSEDADEACLH
ncbi:uncharacterized protein EDB91DRAFT_1343406 [Suillus paluster]|uniref:uncharacterized protein n=1 Tax=Suillus paluster TaxID=48578 RepID=UPI001B879D65|nr:uncharacterized protein EDB91DRAFT_1343406 [Suillus paluster]KAG1754085.1 hypothetical protein EDB91DRAFT_1343406 [Suillus paluster]